MSWVGEDNRDSVKTYTLSPEEFLGPLNDIEQKYAPKRFYVAGKLSIMRSIPRIAIIGSRKASQEGLKRSEELTEALVNHGATIVSGLAEGIDTSAHQTAIDEGGRTIAVLGTSLDKNYPAKNRNLQKLIMKEHLAVTQFPSGYPINRSNFPMRNRTMALISHASVIVEADDTSGALSQGWETIRLGRPLFIMKAVISNRSLTWPAQMRAYGAFVLSTPEEVLEVLPPPGSNLNMDAALKA